MGMKEDFPAVAKMFLRTIAVCSTVFLSRLSGFFTIMSIFFLCVGCCCVGGSLILSICDHTDFQLK